MSILIRSVCLGAALACLVSCWGGHSDGPAPARQLSYVPPAGTGFRFVPNAGLSTPSRLVLELLGPETMAGRGVAFTLTAGPGVAWDPIPPGRSGYLENVGFDLGSGIALLKTAVTDGTLQAMVFQKGQGGARALGGPLCRVALVVNGAPAGPIPLAVTAFQVLPATGGALQAAPCELGTLAAQ